MYSTLQAIFPIQYACTLVNSCILKNFLNSMRYALFFMDYENVLFKYISSLFYVR